MARSKRNQVAQPIAQFRDDGAPESSRTRPMMSRSTQSSVTGRASAMRRLRRRAAAVSHLYCRTNGCASFLEVDASGALARCPICGFERHLN
jgi:hypothetical protein